MNTERASDSGLLASLPMYDWPEISEATNQLWQWIRPVFNSMAIEPPVSLSRPDNFVSHWQDQRLIFSQTCGLPLVTELGDSVHILGTPDYAVDGHHEGRYASQIVVRLDDSRMTLSDYEDAVVAINGRDSHSGFHALRLALAETQLPSAFFAREVVSGSHRNSLTAVATGNADLCCIDPVSWDLCKRFEPEAVAMTRVLGHTPYAPALPYICAVQMLQPMNDSDVGTFKRALQTRIEQLTEPATEQTTRLARDIQLQTRLTGLKLTTLSDYQAITESITAVIDAGHKTLC